MQNLPSYSTVAFGGYACRFEFHDDAVAALLDFLFGHMMVDEAGKTGNGASKQVAYYVLHSSHDNVWHISCNGDANETYQSINALGNFLSGDVLFRLIESNKQYLAIHAGLVSQTRGSILLPAESGSGKTSVTAWLIHHGWYYHTDELVLVDFHANTHLAFSRPLNIKSSGLEPIQQLLNITTDPLQDDRVRHTNGITMMHQSIFNLQTSSSGGAQIPAIQAIVFPHYSRTESPRLETLSAAAAGLELMRSNVIARNLPEHGFSDIVGLVKNTPAYNLHYQKFDDLDAMFKQVIASW